MSRVLGIVGAALFFAWGVLHIAAVQQVYGLASRLEPGVVQGRLFQDAFYILAFAAAAMLLAAGWIWRSDKRAIWLAITTTAIADIPFIAFLVIPGHVGPPISYLGPSLWIAASLACLAVLASAPSTKA